MKFIVLAKEILYFEVILFVEKKKMSPESTACVIRGKKLLFIKNQENGKNNQINLGIGQ